MYCELSSCLLQRCQTYTITDQCMFVRIRLFCPCRPIVKYLLHFLEIDLDTITIIEDDIDLVCHDIEVSHHTTFVTVADLYLRSSLGKLLRLREIGLNFIHQATFEFAAATLQSLDITTSEMLDQ